MGKYQKKRKKPKYTAITVNIEVINLVREQINTVEIYVCICAVMWLKSLTEFVVLALFFLSVFVFFLSVLCF